MVVTAKKDPEVDDETPEATTDDAGAEETSVDEAQDDDSDDAVAAVTDDDDEPAEADEDDESDNELLKSKRVTTSRFNRPWRQDLRRSILPVLLIAALAVSGFLGWKQWQEHQIKVAGQQAQQAAIAYAQVLTSIDSNKVDENFRQVLDGATGEFKDMYTQSSVQLRQLLIDNKASAHGVVIDSAIQSESTNKVVVLVFIDQTVANSASPDPRIDRSRIKMTMEKVDGRWRASKVQLL